MFPVSTLAILITTKASDEGKLGAGTKRQHYCVLHAASYADDPLLFAVQGFQSLRHLNDLLGVLTCITGWLDVDTGLEVGTSTPRVNHITLVNCDAVASA